MFFCGEGPDALSGPKKFLDSNKYPFVWRLNLRTARSTPKGAGQNGLYETFLYC